MRREGRREGRRQRERERKRGRGGKRRAFYESGGKEIEKERETKEIVLEKV